jgi:uncharacterized protein (TIGR02270 family)
MSVPVIENIVAQHAEEACFLWLLRDKATVAPHYSLSDLAKLEDRVEAHLDGLRIAGESGWAICKEALTFEDAGEVFTIGVLAFESGQEQRITEVIEAGTQSVEVARGMISALGWLTYERAQPYIRKLIEAKEPMQRRIGIGGAAVHRKELGPVLRGAVSDPDPLVRSRALKAAGELGRQDLLLPMRASLNDQDEGCRFWSAWSTALLGDLIAVNVLRMIAESGGTYAEQACQMAMRRALLPQALAWQKQLANQETYRRLAAIGAGTIGDPLLIPWLLQQMSNPKLSRVAGEAFTLITGVDWGKEHLEEEKPERLEEEPADNPKDEEVAMDPDEELPWPNLERIKKWWDQNNGRFSIGARYLVGKPIAKDSLQQLLRTGMQRQRIAAALELALQQPGQPLFEVRMRGDRQKILLGI